MREKEIWPEPEHKEDMARSIGSFDPDTAAEWMAMAAAQRASRLSDYKAAVKAWKAAKPKPEDFISDDDRARVEQFRSDLKAKNRAQFEQIWGTLIANLPPGDYPIVKKS